MNVAALSTIPPVAMDILSVLMTSMSTEGIFWKAEFVATDHRLRLSQESVTASFLILANQETSENAMGNFLNQERFENICGFSEAVCNFLTLGGT
jgi:hypothetical protein